MGETRTKSTGPSEQALAILDQMVPGLAYTFPDLRQLAPGLSADSLREVMHELWIAHHVARFGDSGWRRDGPDPLASGTADVASLRVGSVRPEDLFDHDAFAGWFK